MHTLDLDSGILDDRAGIFTGLHDKPHAYRYNSNVPQHL